MFDNTNRVNTAGIQAQGNIGAALAGLESFKNSANKVASLADEIRKEQNAKDITGGRPLHAMSSEEMREALATGEVPEAMAEQMITIQKERDLEAERQAAIDFEAEKKKNEIEVEGVKGKNALDVEVEKTRGVKVETDGKIKVSENNLLGDRTNAYAKVTAANSEAWGRVQSSQNGLEGDRLTADAKVKAAGITANSNTSYTDLPNNKKNAVLAGIFQGVDVGVASRSMQALNEAEGAVKMAGITNINLVGLNTKLNKAVEEMKNSTASDEQKRQYENMVGLLYKEAVMENMKSQKKTLSEDNIIATTANFARRKFGTEKSAEDAVKKYSFIPLKPKIESTEDTDTNNAIISASWLVESGKAVSRNNNWYLKDGKGGELNMGPGVEGAKRLVKEGNKNGAFGGY